MDEDAGHITPLLAPGSTELLAPARDLACGRAAVDCGADAVYIGAPQFGAREAAGNSLDDIAALAGHAHLYRARVYAALNTLLTDDEIPRAVELAHRLQQAGVDGLIIQDLGLLECGLPPLPLIASTQMHNASPARVAFLARLGFSRAILARELSLAEIRAVRAATAGSGGGDIELECFVHGALCASCSGRCHLSFALGGRSANRGRCAQPCRRVYRALDRAGRTVAEGHLLSLRDLGLWRRLGDLIDAGVASFKIEGRLKDASYVANLTAFYRARLDQALAERGLMRSSSGTAVPGFTPDPGKTFNRGYTEYMLDGVPPRERVTTFATPKMTGEEVGRVVGRERGGGVVLDREAHLRAGDGVAWFDEAGSLTGSTVNAARGRVLVPGRSAGLTPGRVLYRNRDLAFLKALAAARPQRRIAVDLVLSAGAGQVVLAATDEDGVGVRAAAPWGGEAARNPEEVSATATRQLARTGDTPFAARTVSILGDGLKFLSSPEELKNLRPSPIPFLPVSALNALRREALALLVDARERSRPRPGRAPAGPAEARMAEPEDDFSLNVLNRAAEAFHLRHGAAVREWAAESGLSLEGRRVMTCRWCLRRELGLCPRTAEGGAEELALVDDEGRRLTLVFDCAACRMEVWFGRGVAGAGPPAQ